ncbi:MAG: AzlD domain-containing protein [Clostridia bacterium]|nr:AzlD domain-containing protein [Clostridia bacterium]
MNIYIYIACMAGVTFLIRVLPLTLIRKEIKNRTLRSFLYYVPYVTLAVMTFPAILNATQSPIAAAVALLVAIVLAWLRRGLFTVATASCLTVLLLELFL